MTWQTNAAPHCTAFRCASVRGSWHPEVLQQHDVANSLPPVHDNGFAVLGPCRAKHGDKVLRKLNCQPPCARFRIDNPDGIAGGGRKLLPVGTPNGRSERRELPQDLTCGSFGDFQRWLVITLT